MKVWKSCTKGRFCWRISKGVRLNGRDELNIKYVRVLFLCSTSVGNIFRSDKYVATGNWDACKSIYWCRAISAPNWNLSTNFISTSQNEESWKPVQQFSSCFMRTDGQTMSGYPVSPCAELFFIKPQKHTKQLKANMQTPDIIWASETDAGGKEWRLDVLPTD
jgi:hypothetical protein